MRSLFEIGQKVVCVDSRVHSNLYSSLAPDLVEGKIYSVDGVGVCVCGLVVITLTGHHATDKDHATVCSYCGHELNDNFYKQTRFVPLEFDRQADEEIRQALKETLRINN